MRRLSFAFAGCTTAALDFIVWLVFGELQASGVLRLLGRFLQLEAPQPALPELDRAILLLLAVSVHDLCARVIYQIA